MPGFGSGPFGYGPFGRFNWSRQVLWNDLPEIDRQRDADEADGRLDKFIQAVQTPFDFLREKADDFTSLRDPDTVRTQFNGKIAVTIASAEADSTGKLIRVTLTDPDPSDPFDPLGDTSMGWVLQDADKREFTVNAVHKIENRIDVQGEQLPTLGAATLRPQSMIEFLGEDYGIEIDRHEPEAYQRSAVRNAPQWLDLKGAAKAYDIIGKISGYRITALGLWRVDPVPDAMPAASLYEMPAGSGKFYTDLAPLRPRFDEVAADVVPVDMFCWETSAWGSPPPSPAPAPGSTVSEAIASLTQGFPIVSSTDLGDGRWRVRFTGDTWPIIKLGQWYAEFSGMPGQGLFMETLTDAGGGDWDIEVYAGDAPTFGATVDLAYQCPADISCGYCRASVIRVEVVPQEVVSDPDALLDGALPRIVRKIQQVVPAHVRIAEIVHIVGPIQATMNIQAVVSEVSREVLLAASVGYYFDITPADEIIVDPDHMVASISSFTIP